MIWYIKAGLLFFTALILVPYLYKRLRPNEPPILEGTYPETKSEALSKHGDFDSGDLPGADLPVFGPSMSTPGRYVEMEVENEWLHPDVSLNRELLKKKAEEKEEEEE